jgi:hypothetical protein
MAFVLDRVVVVAEEVDFLDIERFRFVAGFFVLGDLDDENDFLVSNTVASTICGGVENTIDGSETDDGIKDDWI